MKVETAPRHPHHRRLLDYLLSDLVHHPGRLKALWNTRLLDTPPEEGFDRLTRLAVEFTRSPIALVTLIDEKRQFFKSSIGLPEPWASLRETPLSHSFCIHGVENKPLLVHDANQDPRVSENPAIRDLKVVAYLGMPLTTSEGYGLGSFCVIDSSPRQWTEKDVRVVKELACSAMTEIELRHAAREATEANHLREQFVATLSHDLRNPISAANTSAQLLLRYPEHERSRAHLLGKIIASLERADGMIQDLLDVNLVQAGRACPEHPSQIEPHRSAA